MKKITKRILGLFLTGGLLVNTSFTAMAQWEQAQDGRWWYSKENEAGYSTQWELIDGLWYYFDQNGWMLSDTTTPDGYYVGMDGAYVCKNDTWSDEVLQNYIGVYDNELNQSNLINMNIDKISNDKVWGDITLGNDVIGETFAVFNGNTLINNAFTVVMNGYIVEEVDPSSEDCGDYLGPCSDKVEIKISGTHTGVPVISITKLEGGLDGDYSYSWIKDGKRIPLTSLLALKRFDG